MWYKRPMADPGEPDETPEEHPSPAPTPADLLTQEPRSKGEKTRRRILELAIQRFGERGYRRTSVSEIARAAGLTQAAVYAYFAGKDELFAAAVDADAELAIQSVRAQLEGIPAAQLFPAFLLFAIPALDQHPLVKRILSGSEREVLPRLLDLPALRRLTDWIAERLRQGQLTGEIRLDLDCETVAAGAEAVLLSLLMAVTQVGGSYHYERQLGVVSLFDTLVRPCPDATAPAAGASAFSSL
ncbi:MAG: hypothetical protein KatS3mg008_0633 [Acidimicrobiales bacterium]|nr:MAG: hypothetical protein KatS3mg008_0633 [Acidimicrobiales bacterium]